MRIKMEAGVAGVILHNRVILSPLILNRRYPPGSFALRSGLSLEKIAALLGPRVSVKEHLETAPWLCTDIHRDLRIDLTPLRRALEDNQTGIRDLIRIRRADGLIRTGQGKRESPVRGLFQIILKRLLKLPIVDGDVIRGTPISSIRTVLLKGDGSFQITEMK